MPDEKHRDERLAAVLESLLADGDTESRSSRLESAIADNPDLETELRELTATAMVAEDVAAFQSGSLSEILSSQDPILRLLHPFHPGWFALVVYVPFGSPVSSQNRDEFRVDLVS